MAGLTARGTTRGRCAAMHLHSTRGRLPNEEMQQTKPGVTTHGPVFAADLRCSPDTWQALVT